MALDNVLGGQMDAYAERLPDVDVQQLAHMRDVLRQRPDFRYEMYFDGLTYFGASGIAMSNGLSEQLGNMHEALLKSLTDGTFDRA